LAPLALQRCDPHLQTSQRRNLSLQASKILAHPIPPLALKHVPPPCRWDAALSHYSAGNATTRDRDGSPEHLTSDGPAAIGFSAHRLLELHPECPRPAAEICEHRWIDKVMWPDFGRIAPRPLRCETQ